MAEHGSLFAGLTDQTNAILDWQLEHQTARGVWAWGDEVSQDGSRLIGGDMPHGWTAAEYVCLVRDMLLYERDDTLQIAAGVRAEWLTDGKAVAVNELPTYFGPLTYKLTRSGSTVTLDVQTSAPPPGGYDLHLPFGIATAAVDNAPPTAVGSTAVHLPPGARHTVFQLA
jgi:hypothetical protein